MLGALSDTTQCLRRRINADWLMDIKRERVFLVVSFGKTVSFICSILTAFDCQHGYP
jgi:hypothetical protein